MLKMVAKPPAVLRNPCAIAGGQTLPETSLSQPSNVPTRVQKHTIMIKATTIGTVG